MSLVYNPLLTSHKEEETMGLTLGYEAGEGGGGNC